MSAGGRPGRDIRRPSGWGSAVLTVVAAVAGGLAATAVGPRHVSLVAAVAVSLVIGAGAAAVAGRRDAAAAQAASGPAELESPLLADSQAAETAGWPRQDTAEQVRVLSGQGGVPWWESARQELPSATSAVSAPAPELASYLETAQVAQCPGCGELTLDATHVSGGWALNCPSCSHAWTWRPGTPWPDVTVIPGRRLAPGQPPASSRSGNSRGPAGGPPAQRR